MAKKNVMTDFNSLKGKISFSETGPKSNREQNDPKVKRCQTIREPEEGVLKVGQCVVLMDSDLRGKIVSIGKKVKIELEDGLTIDAAYGEFAVTDASEISCLEASRVKRKPEGKCGKKGSTSSRGGNISVDLHIEAIPGGRGIPKGMQLQFQMETFKRVIAENLCHRGMTITFIHGIGDGILKAAIRKELDEVLALRCSYSVGDPAITVVTIK